MDVYYAKYIAWAARNNLVSGYAGGTFKPDENVTREQMAVIMKKYADYIGKTAGTETNAVAYSDAASISSWAGSSSVSYCAGNGLISGYADGSFRPQATATRAQVATVLMNFVNGPSK